MNINHFYPKMHTGLTKRPALNHAIVFLINFSFFKNVCQECRVSQDCQGDIICPIHNFNHCFYIHLPHQCMTAGRKPIRPFKSVFLLNTFSRIIHKIIQVSATFCRFFSNIFDVRLTLFLRSIKSLRIWEVAGNGFCWQGGLYSQVIYIKE